MTDTYACGITMSRPEGDLYEILGVPNEASTYLCEQQGLRLRDADQLTDDARYAWKALSDPVYNRIYRETKSTKALFDAGFFDDGLFNLAYLYGSYDPSFATVPLDKLRRNYDRFDNSVEKVAVLVTTGGMAPIHNGHIAMMEKAREIVEARGYSVAAGYLTPGHDSYVGQKYGGTAAIPAEHRCAMVELAVQDSDWLECNSWPSRYMPAEINFTDVVEHLSQYIKFHHSSNVEIFYVFGSDNAGFAAAYPKHSIAIGRSEISSKMAREGNHDHLDPVVRDYLLTWDKQDTSDLPYLIRNEENLAINIWARQFGKGETAQEMYDTGEVELEKRRVQLQSTIRLGIAQVFKNLGHFNKVHLLPVSQQIEEAKKVIGDRKILSLESFMPGAWQLRSSRYFAMSESQHKPLFRAERPGANHLENQIANIPPGEYVLVEDDTVTGGTIKAVMSLLPPDIKITDQVILSDFGDYKGTEYYDVVDLRDFIVGSIDGGLCVVLPDGIKARVPYAAPYVSLRSRAKIPASAELEISRIIWQANVRFFAGSNVKISDTSIGFRRFAHRMGWADNELMTKFCQWHVDRLLEPHLE